jgi:hypothetical protein
MRNLGQRLLRQGGFQTRPYMNRDPYPPGRLVSWEAPVAGAYLPSFQMSAASFQSLPTFSHTTTYFPVTSCGVGPLVFRLNVPISRAAEGPSGLPGGGGSR